MDRDNSGDKNGKSETRRQTRMNKKWKHDKNDGFWREKLHTHIRRVERQHSSLDVDKETNQIRDMKHKVKFTKQVKLSLQLKGQYVKMLV